MTTIVITDPNIARALTPIAETPLVPFQLEPRQPKETAEAMLRRVIREELRKDADRKSYAAAGGYIALKDMPDLTGMAIGTIYKLRMARRRAKEANRDAIFPPEYEPARGRVKFKIAEVQEWMERKQK